MLDSGLMLGYVLKILLTTTSNVLPLHIKQTFPPITEGEGNGIESRLPFKIFSALNLKKLF